MYQRLATRLPHCPVLLGCFLSLSSSAIADGWPAFRGPTGQGISVDSNLPVHWSETENITWRTPIPGKGWSSPVIWGNQIWMTTAIEDVPTEREKAELLKNEKQPGQKNVAKRVSMRAVCLHKTTGDVIQDIELVLVENPDSIHTVNSYASPTPVVTQQHVFLHFGTFGTFCLDRNTMDVVWKRQITQQHAVGPGSSPIVWQNLLVLVCDGMQQQYVTALDCQTGDVVWKTDRPPMDGDDGDFHKAFSTALAIQSDGVSQILVPAAQWFVSYEPTSGKMLWHVNHGKGFSNVAAPVFDNNVCYLITGFTKPELWAIPVSARGEISRKNVLWEQKKQVPKKASPLLHGEDLYMISDSGVLSCVDTHSGSIRWVQRLGGNFSASPVLAEEQMYFCNHEGVTHVVKPSADHFESLAENTLDGQIMASPATDDGALFLRTDQALYRIENSQ